MGCCDTMLRYIVFLINFVFFLASVALISIGAYIHINMTEYLDFLNKSYLNAAIVLMIIGGVILIVAFFGCCGACTENACMMYTYGTLLALILISMIGATITIIVFKGDVKNEIEKNMKTAMQNYGENDKQHDGVKQTWDIVQSDFKCCGVEKYSDWFDTPYGKNVSGVPDSCCKVEVTGCGKNIEGSSDIQDKINTNGCFSQFEVEILDNVGIAIGVGVGIAILILLGVIIACCQARNMREERSYA